MKERHICVITPYIPSASGHRGGIHAHTDMLIRLLLKSGRRVTVIAPGKPCIKMPADYNLAVMRVGNRDFLTPRWFEELRRTFSSMAETNRPDQILSEGYYALGLEKAAADIPILVFTHNFHLIHFRTNFLEIDGYRSLASYLLRTVPKLFFRMLRYEIPFLHRVSKVISASEHHALLLKRYYRLPHDKVFFLQNCIDPEKFRPPAAEEKKAARRALGLAEGQTVFLTMGALWRPKGFHIALEAFKRIAGERQDAALLLGGAGPWEKKLKDIAGDLRLSRRVIFLGDVPRESLPGIYGAADIFLMTSLFPEVLSYALLEAMACGLAPIATAVGGNAEAAGNAGLFVPPGDILRLKEAMLRLAADPVSRNRLAAAARKRAAGLFSEKTALGKLESLLQGDHAHAHKPSPPDQ